MVTYNKDYDFKFEHTIEDEDGNAKTKTTWFFYLEDNTCVVVHARNDKSETQQHPMIESEQFGIQLWSKERGCWVPYRDDIQEAYSNYIAEKELLEK